jgi:2-keto-4-pentenoate hydratase
MIAALGPLGGYKVGAAGADAPISLAPLPASGIVTSGAVLTGWPRRLVEAEIAVKFAQDLPPRGEPYGDTEVWQAVGSVHPVIEVLSSGFCELSNVDPLSQAADLGIHGGLIVGAPVTLPDLAMETVRLLIDGVEVSSRRGHPSGDMMRLLRRVAGERGVQAGQIVTTGSWNPLTIAPETCEVVVSFAHAGVVRVRFTP